MRRRHTFAGRRARAETGSAFVESIVAAAIVALALGATFRVVADGAARDRGAEARRAALLVAQSELAAVGADIPLAPGNTSGESGDLAWRVDISPYAENDEKNPAGELLRVAVSVRPREGGSSLVTLQSLRLGAGS
ncbi:MAG: hypothetical protein JWO83_3008 [Caulobacteraceae bacterium]|nr:hypothetical protein [Caulobacteraceae bacterium]